MSKETKAPARRTYSIASERASELSHSALKMTDTLGKTVARQDVLDALVQLLVTDSVVYNKVIKLIAKK